MPKAWSALVWAAVSAAPCPCPPTSIPNQLADRRQQEDIGHQAADDRDARARQRFLLHVAVLAVPVRLEQQRGQRGAQRQRVERTDDRRGGDRQRELSDRTGR